MPLSSTSSTTGKSNQRPNRRRHLDGIDIKRLSAAIPPVIFVCLACLVSSYSLAESTPGENRHSSFERINIPVAWAMGNSAIRFNQPQLPDKVVINNLSNLVKFIPFVSANRQPITNEQPKQEGDQANRQGIALDDLFKTHGINGVYLYLLIWFLLGLYCGGGFSRRSTTSTKGPKHEH